MAPLNINLNNIQKKLMTHADKIAFLYAGYSRFDGDLGQLMHHYTSKDVIDELRNTLKGGLEGIKWKLFDTGHAYSEIFKISIGAYILAELGVVPPKYKKTIEKVLWGTGLAAITLQGSNPQRQYNRGGNRSTQNSETWKYPS